MSKLISKFKTPARALAKRFPLLRKAMRKAMYAYRRTLYMMRGLGISVDAKTVIFETFNGKSYSDSPKAIYEYMKGDPRFDDYKFIWIFKEPEKYTPLLEDGRTSIVKYHTAQCEKALAGAKYWIFNYRALDHWIPKSEQVYVQCWHGTPLKKLGYDIEKSDNAMNSLEEIRDKYYRDAKRFKYLLSPCAFATEKFKTAWNLKALGKEDAIIEVGYPRNDFLVNHTKEDVARIKRKLRLDSIDKKIILYAPTWRDNQHRSGTGYTYRPEVDFEYLREQLGNEYIILFRAHYLVANSFDFSKYEGFVYDVSEIDDINELYVISDMLVTDYSSVFFDYAILERPIIFYMYDLEEYRDEIRGFYLGLEELPGRIAATEEKLVGEIRISRNENEKFCNKAKTCKFNAEFNNLNNGNVSNRVIKKIIT